MAIDQPLVSYNKDKKLTKKKADEIADRWEENRTKFKKGETISLTDYFNKKQ